MTGGAPSAPARIRTEPLRGSTAAALSALLAEHSGGCFCRFWHFGGDDNAWQERCALAPEDNRRELLAAISAGAEEAAGVVAWGRSGGREELVGWLKLCPASSLGKLRTRRTYRNFARLAGDLRGVWVVACFLVRPAWRRRGVARALLEEALALAVQAGARSLLALPRRSQEVLRADELWLGPLGMFEELGFAEVESLGPYPLFERELGR